MSYESPDELFIDLPDIVYDPLATNGEGSVLLNPKDGAGSDADLKANLLADEPESDHPPEAQPLLVNGCQESEIDGETVSTHSTVSSKDDSAIINSSNSSGRNIGSSYSSIEANEEVAAERTSDADDVHANKPELDEDRHSTGLPCSNERTGEDDTADVSADSEHLSTLANDETRPIEERDSSRVYFQLQGEPSAVFQQAPIEKNRRLSKYRESLAVLFPIRLKPRGKNPIEKAGLLSAMTFSWLTFAFSKAYKSQLSLKDLWQSSGKDGADQAGERLEKFWAKELNEKGKEKASFAKVMIRFNRTFIIALSFCQLIFSMSTFLTAAIITEKLLQYVEAAESNLGYGIGLVVAIMATEGSRSLSIALFWFISYRGAQRLHSAILSTTYKKLMRLHSLQEKTIGEFVNLCTNDSSRIFEGSAFIGLLIGGIIIALLDIIYSAVLLGPAALLGSLSVFFIFWPAMAIVGKFTAKFRQIGVKLTDKRVRMMNELLTCVKLIKMYAWEIPFSKTISTLRREEKSILLKAAYCQAISISIGPTTPTFATMLIVVLYTSLGNNITVTQAFTLVALLNTLRFVVTVLPWCIRFIVESKVASQRIKSLLLMDELESFITLPTNSSHAIAMSQATLGWKKIESQLSAGLAPQTKPDIKGKGQRKRKKHNINGTEKTPNHSDIPLNDLKTIPEEKKLLETKDNVSTKKGIVEPVLFDINFTLEKVVTQIFALS